MTSAAAISIIGLPLGIAAAAIDVLVALARTKTPFFSAAPLCEQEHVQLEVAWAKTRLLAARAFAFGAVDALWASESSGQPASAEQQALLRMACCNAGDVGKQRLWEECTRQRVAAPYSKGHALRSFEIFTQLASTLTSPIA
jgi:alkylation response protein AidB-like acyl-CoA dehydrogenase